MALSVDLKVDFLGTLVGTLTALEEKQKELQEIQTKKLTLEIQIAELTAQLEGFLDVMGKKFETKLNNVNQT